MRVRQCSCKPLKSVYFPVTVLAPQIRSHGFWRCINFCLCVYASALLFWSTCTVIHTHPFNGPLSGTTRVRRQQKGKTNLDFTEARDSMWQWHQLGHMQVCTSLQTDNHVSTPPLSFFRGRMPFLPPNQQRQSTEGSDLHVLIGYYTFWKYIKWSSAFIWCKYIDFRFILVVFQRLLP